MFLVPKQVVLSGSEVLLERNDPKHGVEQDDTEQDKAHSSLVDSLGPCEGILKLENDKSMYQKYYNLHSLPLASYTLKKSLQWPLS